MVEIKGNKLYHSTKVENLDNILVNGLKTGCDGCIYFADSIQNSLKFVLIRGIPLDETVTIEVDIKDLDSKLIDFSYDHSESFFGCKAYLYTSAIPVEVFHSIHWNEGTNIFQKEE